MVNIGIDARLVGSKTCGMSRTTLCLLRALPKIKSYKAVKYIVYAKTFLSDLPQSENFIVRPCNLSRFNPLHDIYFSRMLAHDQVDLYHSMHPWLPRFLPRHIKAVVTMYDLFTVTDPNFFIKYKPFHGVARAYFRFLTEYTMHRSDAIVTISNYSKKEIARVFPLAEMKTYVMYLASGMPSRSVVGDDAIGEVSGEYLLFVGNSRSYKNLDILISGFHLFCSRSAGASVALVIAGNDNYSRIERLVRSCGLEKRVIFFSKPSDAVIKKLYTRAIACVCPSRYEGFGMSALEAMAFNVPVIVSDADALVEVAGNAAIVFAKNSPEHLADAIEKVVGDEDLRDSLRRKGRDRLKAFSWESSALTLSGIYESTLKGR